MHVETLNGQGRLFREDPEEEFAVRYIVRVDQEIRSGMPGLYSITATITHPDGSTFLTDPEATEYILELEDRARLTVLDAGGAFAVGGDTTGFTDRYKS